MDYLKFHSTKSKIHLLIISSICLFFLTSNVFGTCQLSNEGRGNTVEELLSCLQDYKTPVVRQKAIFSIHRLSKEAIPALIENISNSKKVVAYLSNPLSSGPLVRDPPMGVFSAYLIESILGRERLEERTIDNIPSTLGNDPNNYVYWNGFIVNSQNELIKDGDLIEVQKIYRVWWEKNKDESICELREGWKNGERILNGKDYEWK
ncbi:MAG: hypothetical protein R2747_02050 [Pyrinomonadaceae bacterium]